MNHRIIHIFLPLIFGALPIDGAAEGAFKPLRNYPFVRIENGFGSPLPDVSDSLFDASAQGIHFALNRSELRDDDSFIHDFKTDIVPLLRQKGLVLRKIVIKGSASPEGAYENNCRLGRERTRNLMQFVCQQLGDTTVLSKVEVFSVCEDYDHLILLMEQAHDPELAEAKIICSLHRDDNRACKKALMALNGGLTWKRWLRDYFPSLRQARVMMWFGSPLSDVTSQIAAGKPLVCDSAQADVPYVEVPAVEGDDKEKRHRLPLIAVRTNLVHDFFYMPNFGWAPGGNIQLEYFPLHGHLTYNIGFTFTNHRHWKDYKFFQIRDLQLELRRYFKEGHPYRGAYLGAYAHGFAYGIGFNENKGWEGEGGGAGISGGYTLSLIPCGHLRLELMAAVGFLFSKYDPYVYGNPVTGNKNGKYYYDYTGRASLFRKRSYQYTWLGPTNLGIQLTYDLIYRKSKKGGVE